MMGNHFIHPLLPWCTHPSVTGWMWTRQTTWWTPLMTRTCPGGGSSFMWTGLVFNLPWGKPYGLCRNVLILLPQEQFWWYMDINVFYMMERSTQSLLDSLIGLHRLKAVAPSPFIQADLKFNQLQDCRWMESQEKPLFSIFCGCGIDHFSWVAMPHPWETPTGKIECGLSG